MLSRLLAFVLGYLLGSLPTAFLLVRWKSHTDIRTEGSGNVGTLNSYLVTGSKFVGIAVLAVDAAKGVLAALVGNVIGGGDFWAVGAAAVAAVLGHNFSIWLRFKGGKGLATAAGAMLVISWFLVLLWELFWLAGYLLTKAINPANVIASFLIMAIVLFAPDHLVQPFSPHGAETFAFRVCCALMLVCIMAKHIGPINEYVTEKKEGKKQ